MMHLHVCNLSTIINIDTIDYLLIINSLPDHGGHSPKEPLVLHLSTVNKLTVTDMHADISHVAHLTMYCTDARMKKHIINSELV